jgi:hypothetical protein
MVLFPAPLGPTSATFWPDSMLCMLFFALYHHYLQQAEKDQ